MEAVQTTPPEEPQDVVEDATLVLFTLNGKPYRVPAKPRPVMALRFLDDLRKQGVEVAAAKALPALLGEDTWSQLLEEDDLEPQHLEAIFTALQKLMMGGVDLEGFSNGR